MTFVIRLPKNLCYMYSQILIHVEFVSARQRKNCKYAVPELIEINRTQLWVLPGKPDGDEHALASSSLGVSRELHLALFPQGQPRRGLASHK
jgi:hypothetical protein